MGEDSELQRLFIRALFLTVGIETALLFLLVRRGFKLTPQRLSNPLLLFAGCCASAGTLPYVWFVLPRFFHAYVGFVIVGELLVFAVEAVFYRFVLGLDWRRCGVLSLVCNAGSAAASFLLK